MRLRALLMIMPAAWLLPPMLAIIWLYISSSVTFEAREPYALYLTARAMNSLGLVVPVFAAAAAWEGARLVRGGAWQLPMVRHRVSVAAWSILPAIVSGGIVITVAAMLVVAPQGVPLPEPIVLLAAGSILVAHVAAGFAIGTRLPRSVAVPLVLIVSFMSFVLPRVGGSAWLRHLSGTSLELCCGTDEWLHDGVVVAIAGGSVALVLAAAILVTRHRGALSDLAVAALPLAVAVVLAMLVAPPTVKPVTARVGVADQCMTVEGVEVCLWPEHRAMLPDVAEVASEVVRTWTDMGVVVPTTFREGGAGVDDGAAQLYVRSGSSRDGLIARIAAGVIPPYPDEGSTPPVCSLDDPWPSAIAGPYVWTWLTSVVGMDLTGWGFDDEDGPPDSDYFPDAPPDAIVPMGTVLDPVRALSPARQARWANRNIAAYWRCGVQAPLELR